MEHTATAEQEYVEPVVIDAGEVAEVTLGTASFDSADDTQYKV
ncbi:MAG TPA: lasso RiPP family leader peptide-containing protein [Streptomyces sp.]|nr:lasso RiPP family leader peptide-containing protein [Streptomyces sp.]